MNIHQKITAIVLAAGLSRRMGEQNKLLMPFENEPLLRRIVGMLCNCNLLEVIVVLGYEHEKVETVLSDLNVRCVYNHEYQKGQATSVLCGLSAVISECEGVLIAPADQPFLKESDIGYLIEAYKQRAGKEVVIPVYSGQRGNPIIISKDVRIDVLSDVTKAGCRRYIDSHPEMVKWLNVEQSAFVTDVDTLSDYRTCFANNISKSN